jgi:hypothetical protein
VIATVVDIVRFACHLVFSIRGVHKLGQAIQIVYVGNVDLPTRNRDIPESDEYGAFFLLLDMLTVLDDEILRLADKGWATKSFTALVSKYEQSYTPRCRLRLCQTSRSRFQTARLSRYWRASIS